PPLSTPTMKRVVQGLADAFVAGPWRLDDLVERGGRAIGRRGRWLRLLARRLLAAFSAGGRPAAARVAAFLLADEGLRRAIERHEITSAGSTRLPTVMAPAPGAPVGWRVPEVTTAAALADRFGLDLAELAWFSRSGAGAMPAAEGPLAHYRYRWV